MLLHNLISCMIIYIAVRREAMKLHTLMVVHGLIIVDPEIKTMV